MKTELEIRRELRAVRKALTMRRELDDNDSIQMLYGAQQALAWITRTAMAPSELDTLIYALAVEYEGNINDQ